MTNHTYYDYKKDFPNGNGWISNGYEYEFTGELIDSPNYIFVRGKYKGKSLQFIAEYCWRGIIKYIDYGLIFITKKCIESLKCSNYKITQIKVALDSKLLFCRIVDSNDEMFSRPYPCSYQGVDFLDVYKQNPEYIIGLISRAIFNKYGSNQRFYARDKASTMFGDNQISDLEHIIWHLKIKCGESVYLEKLNKLLDQLKSDRDEYEREMNEILREKMDRDFIDECNREFNSIMDDNEAWWNID